MPERVPSSPRPPAECDSKLLLAKVVAQFGLTSALYRLLPCRWTSWLALAAAADEPQAEDPLLENVRLAFRCGRGGAAL